MTYDQINQPLGVIGEQFQDEGTHGKPWATQVESHVAMELVGGELYPISVSYSSLNHYDQDRDEYHYHNAATCPDFGQGMDQIGSNLTCLGCGFASCGV